MKKENTASSLRHLNAVLASTACFAAKLLLVLTRCPILVVPGLELPHQQKQMNYANHKYACSIVQVSQIPTRIVQNPQKTKHSSTAASRFTAWVWMGIAPIFHPTKINGSKNCSKRLQASNANLSERDSSKTS